MSGHIWAPLVGISGCSSWSRFFKALDCLGPVTQKNGEPSNLSLPFPPQFSPSSHLSDTSELGWSPEQNVAHLPLVHACQSMRWVCESLWNDRQPHRQADVRGADLLCYLTRVVLPSQILEAAILRAVEIETNPSDFSELTKFCMN